MFAWRVSKKLKLYTDSKRNKIGPLDAEKSESCYIWQSAWLNLGFPSDFNDCVEYKHLCQIYQQITKASMYKILGSSINK